jgi:hypothetical protein
MIVSCRLVDGVFSMDRRRASGFRDVIDKSMFAGTQEKK